MAANTKIEWTDHTWSPVVGCSKIGSGCAHCYAIRHARRLAANPNPKICIVYADLTVLENAGSTINWTGEVRFVRERLERPKSWRKPARIFVNPMSDLFHEKLSFEEIHQVWCAMREPGARHHTYQILTKRYERMAAFFEWLRTELPCEYGCLPQPHIWLGHSYSNQKDAEAGITYLMRTPAAVRFVSLEPLLGPVDLVHIDRNGGTLNALTGEVCSRQSGGIDQVLPRLAWVIAGSESGPGARPMQEAWVRSIKAQCVAARVPFFYKQDVVNGHKIPAPKLDGRRWTQVPKVSHA